MRLTPACRSAAIAHARRASSISFVGLGRMGSEMAFNLFAKRHALAPEERFVICDAVPDAARAFAANLTTHFPAAAVRIVDTPEEAVHASQTLVTMVPSSPQVRAVYADARGGVLAALRALPPEEAQRTLCIDSTTLDVTTARSVAADVTAAGAQMVDAPVSGGVTGAKAATLAFLVGGPDAAFARAQPLLAHMGRRIVHCGPSGAGLVAKICNNLMLGVHQVVTAEAMLLGQRLGVRADVLADVIGSATGACWACNTNNPVPGALPDKAPPPCERDYEGGFATALMLKDMGLASESAAAAGVPLPLGAQAQRVYEEVLARAPELARKDFSSVYLHLEKLASESNLLGRAQ